MDSEAYGQLVSAMSTGAQRREVVEINGDQIYLSGMVNRNHKFIPNGAYHGSSPGITSGESTLSVRLFSRALGGSALSEVIVPISFKMEIQPLDEGGESEIETMLAPVSTGIPFSNSTLSIEASVVDSAQKAVTGNVTIFYPSIELLRGALNRVPISHFFGNPEASYSKLSNIIDEAETLLRSGDLLGAKKKIEGQFKAQVLLSLIGQHQKESSIDVGRREFLGVVDTSVFNLNTVLDDIRFFENDVLKVVPDRTVLSQGERVQFSANAKVKLSSPEDRFVLIGWLDGNSQKVELQNGGNGWSIFTSKLEAGSYVASFRIFRENRRLADSILASIDIFYREIFDLMRRKGEETDPEKVSQIQSEIELLNSQIASLKAKIDKLRSPVGASVDIDLNVQ